MTELAIAAPVAGAALLAALLLRHRQREKREEPGRGARPAGRRTRPQSLEPAPPLGLRVRRLEPPELTRPLTPPPDGGLPHRCGTRDELGAAAQEIIRAAALKLTAQQGLLGALTSGAHGPQELATLIQTDEHLHRRVLERINGPEYGLDAPVERIARAAILLGHIEIRIQACRACIDEVLRPSSAMTTGAFAGHWQHALTVARTAHALANAQGLPRPEVIAVAGLLHDVGKLLALARWPAEARVYDHVRFSDRPALQAEIDRLGLCHAHLGAELCRSTRLPEETCAIVAHHHAPSYVGPVAVEGDQRALAVVYLADLLAHVSRAHLAGLPVGIVYHPIASWLGLLKARCLEDLLAPHVVLALLDPAATWRGVPHVTHVA